MVHPQSSSSSFPALSELQQHIHRGWHNLPLSNRRVHRVSGEHHQVSQEPQRLPRLLFQVTFCCMHGPATPFLSSFPRTLSLFFMFFFPLSFLHSHYLFLSLSFPCGFLTYPLIPLMISCKTILTLFWLKRMALPQLYNTAVLHTPTNTVRVHATTDFNIINQTKFPFR